LLNLDKRLVLRCAKEPHENPILAKISPLDRQSTVHPGMLVEPLPREFEQRPPQGGVLRSDLRISLHEDAGPRRPRRMTLPSLNERGHPDHSTDRRGGNWVREMNQVADEASRPGKREISPFRLVHPCTSMSAAERSRGLTNWGHREARTAFD